MINNKKQKVNNSKINKGNKGITGLYTPKSMYFTRKQLIDLKHICSFALIYVQDNDNINLCKKYRNLLIKIISTCEVDNTLIKLHRRLK